MFTMKRALGLLLILSPTVSFGGFTAGTILIDTPNARPAALGEAFTAASDDISAFSFNPASLSTLRSGHASFMYQRGLVEDSYGQFMLGAPSKNRGMGLAVSYYNGGNFTYFDGETEKTVNAKTDIAVSLGYARQWGNISLGLSGKYISSKLVETNKATAFAGDIGMQMPLATNARLGFAVQNIGTKLTYVEEANNLPRIVRAGMAFSFFPQAYRTTLSLDAPYYLNDQELKGGLGLETLVGPMALRAGYQSGRDTGEITFGAGFNIGSTSVDYSYGLVQDLEASHKFSVGIRFGKQ